MVSGFRRWDGGGVVNDRLNEEARYSSSIAGVEAIQRELGLVWRRGDGRDEQQSGVGRTGAR